MSWFQKAGEAINAQDLFVGCPVPEFEVTSQVPYQLAIKHGLQPHSRVLEIGCGCLRVGYWFIDFLDKGGYSGIEPNIPMLDAGKELILGNLESEKRPNFSHNDRFDFGGTFDFVIAFSIWSHASRKQIKQMLHQFALHTPPWAKFLGSYFPADRPSDAYEGDEWVGRSHECDEPGIVRHLPKTLSQMAIEQKLSISYLDSHRVLNQDWLIVQHEHKL